MYYFFLGVLPLPVTPSSLNISTPSLNKTVTLINDGEINILKTPGLREISFEALLPQHKYPFANYSISNYTATTFIPVLNELKKSKIPFQFIVTRMKPNNQVVFFTNIKCQIESIEYKEDAEEYGLDVMASIVLKEYKDYGTKSLSLSKSMVSTALGYAKAAASYAVAAAVTLNSRSTESKPSVTSVTVKKGDTLWNICKKYLGDGSKYKEVAELNNLENPDKIYVGQVLRLS